jgi:hypothetical protein
MLSDGKGQRQGQGERQVSVLRTAAEAAPIDEKTALWRDGLGVLKAITGGADGLFRRRLGKLVDAAILFTALRVRVAAPFIFTNTERYRG